MSEITQPREALPPCVKVNLFDGRLAVLYNRSCKCGELFDPTLPRYCSMAGPISGYREAPGHPGCKMPRIMAGTEALHLDTDDLDSAQVIFERGAEWVRTGELDEN